MSEGTSPEPANSKSKRKKASRACGHCQKAHLTCDDQRPCSRCVKRELQDTCADGHRKKAKYLLDVDEDDLDAPQSSATSQQDRTPPDVHATLNQQEQVSPHNQQQHTQSIPHPPPPPPVQLEYSNQQQQQQQQAPPHIPAGVRYQVVPNMAQQQSQPAISGLGSIQQSVPNVVPPNALLNFPMASDFNFGSEAVNLEYSFLSNMLGTAPMGDPNTFSMSDMLGQPTDLQQHQHQHQHPSQQPNAYNQGMPANNMALHTSMSPNQPMENSYRDNRPAAVYKSVLQPYDYREGFHYLVRYVKERMEKNDIMRICRALAQFRPSFMAQIMNLSEEDLVFMEKCFQRTIMEFDKLIGFSGTPTVVWRRTGEIALVGKEFSILTQWSRDQLLGSSTTKKTYIYELMDNASAVDYWEKFSLIAFDNSQQSMMTTCTLVSPSGRPVPCAFCFTIKRDIFDVPLAIVGNFLPLFRPV
ncbi:uncharacterized protein EV422DRAFT_340883 [Fimicolochytrium jonesii]|uniref:uncharacterized protein n=1 Tax=Fimicolochytrium jonesii TaxID=1396493 RepID=UPI0022FDF7E4|nr:uncharacterized protein EV422DRAFT_340883 [Fimicolochytrium jonesii]KAI8815810.1 hypothetical protein EV422DRAFT_340883 [Fimicolochytrium jonesii]